MIIPSIDIRGGKVVQLRQGKNLVLTANRDPLDLVREFNRYGEVAVIDLDAALGTGDNLAIILEMCRVADIRVGGGIRDIARATALLKAGARKIIIGTAATPEFLRHFPAERVMVALDHRKGVVVDKGWTESTKESVLDRAERLADYCSGYLCTFVEVEGTMRGLPMSDVLAMQAQLPHPMTAAGGAASTDEVCEISKLGIDVQVGMALYKGYIDLADSVIGSLDFEKMSGQIPTIVQDIGGQVLMLAYSTPESLAYALCSGRGAYYSRSRNELWVKGLTSGYVQELVSCRADCDRDSLLFTVRQSGPACHTLTKSCYGDRRFSLSVLFERLKRRLGERPNGSYTVKLFRDRDLLHRKILEEAQEVVDAPDNDNRRWEIGDVIFFLSVLAVSEGLDWSDIENELYSRYEGRRP